MILDAIVPGTEQYMQIVTAIVSVVLLTGLVWFVNRFIPRRICPICAGVAGTWGWMLTASFLGYGIDITIVALLMGGSVVGVAYQLENKISLQKSALVFKTLFIPSGFVVAYALFMKEWGLFFVALVAVCVIVYNFIALKDKKHNLPNKKAKELENKMKNCC